MAETPSTKEGECLWEAKIAPSEWVILCPIHEVFLKPTCLKSTHLGTSEALIWEGPEFASKKKALIIVTLIL